MLKNGYSNSQNNSVWKGFSMSKKGRFLLQHVSGEQREEDNKDDVDK